jgi:hypothetical protein
MGDFSVVLFRSDFVLFSKKNHVKVPKNQWVWTMPYPPEHLSGATTRDKPQHLRCRSLRSDLTWDDPAAI